MVLCRVLKVSRAGYYAWKSRPPSARKSADKELASIIVEVHQRSRATYGAPRVHADLKLGMGIALGCKRVARLMRAAGIAGVYRRRFRRARPDTAPHADLVSRRFTADAPDKLWVTDITEHPASEGKVYCAAVVDVFSRRVVGWAIADHLRSELVVDALEMARWRRKPPAGSTVVHSDRGTQYTSWAFGQRLRQAGLLGSMGRVGSCYDNALIESFWGSLQLEVLDRKRWRTRHELSNAIFDWIEGFYNPHRRHSALGYLAPVQYENQYTAVLAAA